MDVTFQRTSYLVGIGVKHSDRIQKMLTEREITFDEWARRVLVDDLERWEASSRRLAGKPGDKRPVGRPRISEEERRFRDNVAKLQQKFIKLRDVWGAAFVIFDAYYGEFLAAEKAKRYGQIEWMAKNMGTLGSLRQMMDEEVAQFRSEWMNQR